MSVALLDVNILVALAWPTHVHHGIAHEWFAANRSEGWATCPLTQCAFVRVSSNPTIISDAVEPIEAVALLKKSVDAKDHVFWADDIPLYEQPVPTRLLVGHRQVTDAYLLGLAIHKKGRLVTLDHGISSLFPANSPARDALELVRVD